MRENALRLERSIYPVCLPNVDSADSDADVKRNNIDENVGIPDSIHTIQQFDSQTIPQAVEELSPIPAFPLAVGEMSPGLIPKIVTFIPLKLNTTMITTL